MSLFSDGIRYISLGTWRRNGVMVPTPVWFASCAGVLYAFSAGNAGKVKRLRNSSRACVAACDWRGSLRGEWVPAKAFLVSDAAECSAAYSALHQKYGWQMRILDVGSRLGGKIGQRVVIRIEPGA